MASYGPVFVSNFTQKRLNGFAWNLQGGLAIDQWTSGDLVRCALAEVCTVPALLVAYVIILRTVCILHCFVFQCCVQIFYYGSCQCSFLAVLLNVHVLHFTIQANKHDWLYYGWYIPHCSQLFLWKSSSWAPLRPWIAFTLRVSQHSHRCS